MMDAVLNFRRAPAPAVIQGVSASPEVFTNGSLGIQLLTVSGGVVTLLEVNTGAGFAITLGPLVILLPGASLRVTYVTAPSVSLVQL